MRGLRSSELPRKDRPQFLHLLLSGVLVHEHPDPPVAIGHHLGRIGEHCHGQAAHIHLFDFAGVDVKDQHHPAALGVGRLREPRGGAGAHHVARTVLEIGSLQGPGHI
jgi:hypothetical protein